MISRSDLVVVYKPTPCCNNMESIGHIFEVLNIAAPDGRCQYCGRNINEASALSKDGGFWIQLYRLKKIDPLKEVEDLIDMEQVFYDN